MQTAIEAVNAANSGSGTPREPRAKRSRSAPAHAAVSQSAFLPDSFYGSSEDEAEDGDRSSRSRPRWGSMTASSSGSERVSPAVVQPDTEPAQPQQAPASSAVSQRLPAAQRHLTEPQQRFVDDFLSQFPDLPDINGRNEFGWNALHLGAEDH